MIKQFSTPDRRGALPNPETASETAVAALGYLAQEPDSMAAFMSQAGLAPEDLRAASQTPGFLAAVLDYVCSQEPLLLAFAANAGRQPEQIDMARKVLSGPQGEWSA